MPLLIGINGQPYLPPDASIARVLTDAIHSFIAFCQTPSLSEWSPFQRAELKTLQPDVHLYCKPSGLLH